MDINIRPAKPENADFLSWVILTAGLAYVKKGIWGVILGGSEEECLFFLKHLTVTKIPHYFHYSCYLLAEMDGVTVAGLTGIEPDMISELLRDSR